MSELVHGLSGPGGPVRLSPEPYQGRWHDASLVRVFKRTQEAKIVGDYELTPAQEARAIELIKANWEDQQGLLQEDFLGEECSHCDAPATFMMSDSPVCSTECAVLAAEGYLANASDREERRNAAGILTDLEDLIDKAYQEVPS
jgi:hypothetical protein